MTFVLELLGAWLLAGVAALAILNAAKAAVIRRATA